MPRCAPPAPGSPRSMRSPRARDAPPSSRSRPPGHHATARVADGLLPAQQRRRRRGRARRARRAGADRRLRRAPRQRHPGHLLDRSAGALRVAARVAALPRHRQARRRGRRRGSGRDAQRAAARGCDGRRLPARLRRGDRAGRRGVRTDLGARVGRVRRAPGRSAHRPRPQTRATTQRSRRRVAELAAPGA